MRSFSPGRTEIAGNHTDHQGGRVIAAALSLGVTMVISTRDDRRVELESPGFDKVTLDVDDLEPVADERSTTKSLVRGVVAGLDRALPGKIGGFDAQVTSTLPAGGGLSSSAAFELALGAGLNTLFFDRAFDSVALARIGQAAERDYFGKPCGLMDQLCCALGGIQLMDFAEADDPQSTTLDADFAAMGLAVCLVDTHCDHSAFTDEYAQVSRDMFEVARLFGAQGLSRVTPIEFFASFEAVRKRLGDRAALRALHYYREMELVDERALALRAGDARSFLEATRRSGASSAQYLQNVSVFGSSTQPAMVALALADMVLGADGAARIHGGGFGGSIQAFVPLDKIAYFSEYMDAHFGAGSCTICSLSQRGAQATWES